jgi:hypothetical protein
MSDDLRPTERDHRADFVEIMVDEGVPSYVIEGVLHDALVLQRLAERACTDESFGDVDEAHQEQVEARVQRNVQAFGIVAHFQHDPRGAVVKLKLPSGRANDWGGEGYWCVP